MIRSIMGISVLFFLTIFMIPAFATVGTPSATPASMSFFPSIDVTLNIDPASNSTSNSLYYTTDGTDPNFFGTPATNGTLITFTNSTTLNFVETDGITNSTTITETYTLAQPVTPTVPARNGDSPPPSHLKPSLGGVPDHIFNDGLTICGVSHDISNYYNKVPQCALPLNIPAQISIKQQFARGPLYWQHTMIFLNFNGDTNTGNADTWISLNKNDGVIVHDPNKFISNVAAGNYISGSDVRTTFQFTPIKPMKDSNLIIRVWDASSRSTDAIVNGALLLGDAPPTKQAVTYPNGVNKYTDWTTLQEKLINDGFYIPRIMSHIHGSISASVNVYWLYDSINNKVTLVEEDPDGNKLFSQTEKLERINHVITNACNVASFQSLCGSGSIYGFSAETKGLTEDQVQHLLDMGMWSGKIPSGMHINTASH